MGTSSSTAQEQAMAEQHNVNQARAQARREVDARVAARLVGGQQTGVGSGVGSSAESRSGQATAHQPDPPDPMPRVLADSAIDAAVRSSSRPQNLRLH